MTNQPDAESTGASGDDSSGQAATCAWCDLPLSTSLWSGRHQKGHDDYCCFGCRFAAQVTQERGESGDVTWTLTRLGLSIFFAMNVMGFTLALWSQDVYEMDRTETLFLSMTELFRWVCFAASVPVLLLLGVPVGVSAAGSLMKGRITSDLLVAGGVLAAFVYSVVSVFNGQGHIYFEVASTVLVMVTLGRWIEGQGRVSAHQQLESLQKLLPEQVRLVDHHGNDRLVAASTAQAGDHVRVLAGERIPADGLIINQPAFVDEQILTGESEPVRKSPGDAVRSGTLNLDADLIIELTRRPGEGTFANLIEAIRQARLARGYYQRLADRIAAWFVPVVGVIATVTMIVWWQAGDIEQGLLAGLAVVLIACPCALGLATSVAVWNAIAAGASRGVLFRNGEVLERLATVRAVRFDKTGTLTTGTSRVVHLHLAAADSATPAFKREEVLRCAVELARRSSHACSRAIVAFDATSSSSDRTDDARASGVTDITVHAGHGVCGIRRTDGRTVRLGSRMWLCAAGLQINTRLAELLDRAESDGRGTVLIGWHDQVCGFFELDEELRPEAIETIGECQSLGLDVAVLSGDGIVRAARLEQLIGVSVTGGLLPEQKQERLRIVQSTIGPVLMVGDGINDAPALTAADVGMSLAGGTDLSRNVSGVCLLRDNLTDVAWSIDLARRTHRIIRQNLAWAFAYNSFGMTLAVFGWLNPMIAAGLMVVSSVLVLANSRRVGGVRTFREFAHGPQAVDSTATGLADDSPARSEEPTVADHKSHQPLTVSSEVAEVTLANESADFALTGAEDRR